MPGPVSVISPTGMGWNLPSRTAGRSRVALDRRPNAAFDLVAIPAAASSPSQQSANYARARQYADAVMRSLTGMGVPADRISVRTASGQTTPTDEVRLYIR